VSKWLAFNLLNYSFPAISSRYPLDKRPCGYQSTRKDSW